MLCVTFECNLHLQPYLHESRHLHAMKRARGSGGRFLTSKQLQEQARTASTKTMADGVNSSGSTHLRLGNGAAGDRTASGSEIVALPLHESSKRGVAAPASALITMTHVAHKDDDFFQHHGHHLSFSTRFGQSSGRYS
jgi:nuclear transcription factor Y alpha